MPVAAIAGMAGQLGAGILNHASQKANRNYNLMLARMQNSWNVEQWQRENDYNRPINQLKRIQEAGLNPDLVYGNGVQNMSAPSPSMTAGAPSSALDWSSLANANPVRDYLDAQLKQAQINKLNSETEGQDIQNVILTSDSKFRDAWNQGQLATIYSSIRLQHQHGNLTEQQIRESQSRIMKIDSEMSLIDAQMQQIYNAIKNDNARLDLEKAFNKATIEKLASECNLNYEQAFSISSQLEKMLRNWDDKHDLDTQQFILLQNQDVYNYNRDQQTREQTENIKAERVGIQIANGRAKFDAYLNGPDLFSNEYGIINGGLQFAYRLTKTILAK